MTDQNDRVLEVGCADAFGSRLVAQKCKIVLCTDFDKIFIQNAKNINADLKNVRFYVHDFLKKPIINHPKPTICLCLDVLEHIPKKHENKFISHLKKSCSKDAVYFFGSPSKESQKFASKPSRQGHVNCKTGPEMKEHLKKNFKRVILFSMNDEVLHTGFDAMAHYRIAICWL